MRNQFHHAILISATEEEKDAFAVQIISNKVFPKIFFCTIMDNRKISNKNNKMIKMFIKIYNKMKQWIALTMIKISWLKKEKYRKEIQIIMGWYKHR